MKPVQSQLLTAVHSGLRVAFVSLFILALGPQSRGDEKVSSAIVPPVAERVEHVEDRLGTKVKDDYFWLRERDNPKVRAYLEAENQYTTAQLRDTSELQKTLFEEMKSRIRETDMSVPERLGDFEYYRRTVAGKPYRIHCRRTFSPGAATTAPEQILLDENVLAAGHDSFQLGSLRVSPDQSLLAYTVDVNGSEEFTLRFRDLKTGVDLPDSIEKLDPSVEWGADNGTAYYVRIDDAHRPYRVYRHTLGSDAKQDPLIYEEKDESFFVDLSKTRSRRFLLIHLGSQTTTEGRVLDLSVPNAELKVVSPRRPGIEYQVDHHGTDFYILTNDAATNFKVVSAPITDPSREHWKDLLPERPDVKLEEIEAFSDYLVVLERSDASTGLRVINLATGTQKRLEMAEAVCTVGIENNPDFESPVLRFSYSSLTTPLSIIDYDFLCELRVQQKQEFVRAYDPTQYASERIWGRAPDGKSIPISLVYRKGMMRDGRNPLFLEAYGAYGISFDAEFSPYHLSLIDRGFIYAIAHVRGGGDMGRPWYDDGKLLHKQNTFTDFIACAEALIKQGYTSPERLAIRAGSAGGLLIGAVLNSRPDLFRAAIADVPFVDLINTMSDPSLPLTVTEWEEWGDPRRQPDFEYMHAYSPYDNVRAQRYPSLLVIAGLNDPRVGYWEPAKWVARLRKLKTDNHTLLLKTNMDAGHGGVTDRYEKIKDAALQYAFILKELGLNR